MIDWSEINYFKKEEFDCKCGCGLNNMNANLIFDLDEARDISHDPFKINCGCRCDKHNKEVGGVEDSAHKNGFAVDISARDDRSRFVIVSALLSRGFRRILIYDTFIHVDIDLTKVNPILKIMK